MKKVKPRKRIKTVKKVIKSKKERPTKISFLTKRKTIHDKFFDLVSSNTKMVPDKKDKSGKRWKREGLYKLSKALETSPKALQNYIDKGEIKESNEKLWINIERNWGKLKIKKTKKQTGAYYVNEIIPINFNFKKETKEYTIHNFTLNNFFPKQKFGKAKKREQFFWKAGLYIVFERRNRKQIVTMSYIIQNLPLAYYSNSYNKGYNDFFEMVKLELQQYPSLKFFRFNYFNVEKIDISK